MEYLSQFHFNIQYVKGVSNKVADSLSWYYQLDTEEDIHPRYDFVNVDIQLGLEGEDLPWNCLAEIHAINNDMHKQHPIKPQRNKECWWKFSQHP